MKACVTGKMRVFVTDLFWFLFLSMVGIDEEILRFIFGKKKSQTITKGLSCLFNKCEWTRLENRMNL